MNVEAGQRFVRTMIVGSERVDGFADVSGDRNPIHMRRDAARAHGFPNRVAHGAILIAEVSRIIGLELPGPGALWVSSEFEFIRPVYVGSEVEVRAEVMHVSPAFGLVVLNFEASTSDSEGPVFKGAATVKLTRDQAPMNATPLEDQTILVTGGTRGIGRAITTEAARRGARVVALYRSDEAAANEYVQSLPELAGSVEARSCDVADPEAVKAVMDHLSGHPIHSIVHAASPRVSDIKLADLSWDDFDAFLRTYVGGAMNLVQGCRSRFTEHGTGRVVFVGSEVAARPRAGWTHYVTAKAALSGLARALATELASEGTTVNVVSPGAAHSSDLFAPGAKTMISNATPLQRLVTEEEIAEVVLFLLGPGGSFMTGIDLPMSGGRVFG